MAAAKKKKAKKKAQTRSRKKVLLIEDDTFLSGMYIAKLGMENFEVLLAADGKEGIDMAKKEKPDLILLDLILPVIDGYGVLEALKRSRVLSSVPVILLTNLNERENIDRAMKYNVVDYLVKAHFMPSEVIKKIKRVININN
ncbi:response regulator [Patescibacteria group bacterium]|nr:response regulator [Patescibacteria group bacterium]MBU1890521.1 response regulator [Patescibacteria group bacterium]